MPLDFSRVKQANGKFGQACYERREGDQDSFSLLEDVFKVIPKVVPISIDVKDGNNNEVCMKIIDLLKKYERFETTVLGAAGDNYVHDTLLKMDGRSNLICSEFDCILIAFCYFTGFLPYLKINREAFWVPQMTKEYVAICNEEKKNEKSFLKRMKITMIVKLGEWFNFLGDPALTHLAKRGIFCGYWVVNTPSESLCVVHSAIQSVMTDHPHGLKKYYMKPGANDKRQEEGKANTPFVEQEDEPEKTDEQKKTD